MKPRAFGTTLRRKVIDIPAKIIRHARRIVSKIPQVAWGFAHFQGLWNLIAKPPVFYGYNYHPIQWGKSLNLAARKLLLENAIVKSWGAHLSVNKAAVHTLVAGQPAFAPGCTSFPPPRYHSVVVFVFAYQTAQ